MTTIKSPKQTFAVYAIVIDATDTKVYYRLTKNDQWEFNIGPRIGFKVAEIHEIDILNPLSHEMFNEAEKQVGPCDVTYVGSVHNI
jgi:hypothetical protein